MLDTPTKRNAAANYALFCLNAAFGLIVNPILVSSLGSVQFGTWKACQRFLDFASVADGRSSQALKWVVAYRAKSSDILQKRQQVGAAVISWMLWLPVSVVAVTALYIMLPGLIHGLDETSAHLVRLVAMFLGANVVLAGLLGIPDAVLVGSNLGYRSTAVTCAIVLLSNAAMIIVVVLDFGIAALSVVVLSASILNGALTWVLARRSIPWWGVAAPDRQQVKSLVKFSGWVLIWSLVTRVLLSAELLLIGALIGSTEVTSYVFTSYPVQLFLAICLMTTSSFMPALGSSIGSGSLAPARVLIAQTREINQFLSVLFGCALMLLNREFVSHWVGPQFYLGDEVNALMVLAMVQLTLIRCESQIQDVSMGIRSKVLIGILSCTVSLFLAYLLYRLDFGLGGIFAGLIMGRMMMSVAFPIMVNRLVDTSSGPVWRDLAAMVLLVLSYFGGLVIHANDWKEFALISIASGMIVFLVSSYALLPAVTRRKLLRLVYRGNSNG